jgi:spermidine/putrescine ABC transporter ATP-binding subunit
MGISKRFGDFAAVDGIDLSVARGEWLSLVGPSGCGKSTTLRIVAGFTAPDGGRVRIKGADVTAAPPYRRNTGMVFQNYALFPHMTVAENVAYGLRVRRVPKPEIERRVNAALALVQLAGYGGRYPTRELSGGQQQRVALARAIVIEPDVLLLDEPLSNLDARLREDLRVEMAELHRRLGLATIYVTHDQEEALSMSSRVAVMNRGRIEQIGTPEDIYERPATLFVADFIGKVNTVEGTVVETHANGDVALAIPAPGGDIRLRGRSNDALRQGMRAKMAFRAERVRILDDASTSPDENRLAGTVRHVAYHGNSVQYRVALADDLVVSVIGRNLSRSRLALGAHVHLAVGAADCLLFA